MGVKKGVESGSENYQLIPNYPAREAFLRYFFRWLIRPIRRLKIRTVRS